MSDRLQAWQMEHGARFGEVDGARLALDYGDFAGEVRAIRGGLGVLHPQGAGVVAVRGPEAATFLNGLTTNDVQRMPVGRVQGDLLCANKGKIRFVVDVVRMQPEQFLVCTLPGDLEGVAQHLDGYHIREQVELGQVPLERLELLGPAARDALAALGADPAQPIGAFQGAPLLLLDSPLGRLPRVLALLPAAHAQAWLEALLAAEPRARPVGFDAADEARIAAGVPRFGVDFDREFLPAEAALYDRLTFNKGCYVGQEVHARLHHRGHVNRKLCAVSIPEAAAQALAPGDRLYAEGRPVGGLTSLARLAVEGRRPGIAVLRYEALQAGAPLASAPDGPPHVTLHALATDLGAARA